MGVGNGFNSDDIMVCIGLWVVIDLCEWYNLLLGVLELNSSGVLVGGLIGVCGCVYEIFVVEFK